jgi:hypothetical protein
MNPSGLICAKFAADVTTVKVVCDQRYDRLWMWSTRVQAEDPPNDDAQIRSLNSMTITTQRLFSLTTYFFSTVARDICLDSISPF